ncbi:hypothetical protein U1Q18_022092 [Sarracenia purpurea var. burkii]
MGSNRSLALIHAQTLLPLSPVEHNFHIPQIPRFLLLSVHEPNQTREWRSDHRFSDYIRHGLVSSCPQIIGVIVPVFIISGALASGGRSFSAISSEGFRRRSWRGRGRDRRRTSHRRVCAARLRTCRPDCIARLRASINPGTFIGALLFAHFLPFHISSLGFSRSDTYSFRWESLTLYIPFASRPQPSQTSQGGAGSVGDGEGNLETSEGFFDSLLGFELPSGENELTTSASQQNQTKQRPRRYG